MDLMALSLLTTTFTGGAIAASYETYARIYGWPVGFYFRSSGIMSILGGIIGLAALIAAFFVNPWWSIFIILVVGIIATQVLIRFFKIYSTVLSTVLLLVGMIGILIRFAM